MRGLGRDHSRWSRKQSFEIAFLCQSLGKTCTGEQDSGDRRPHRYLKLRTGRMMPAVFRSQVTACMKKVCKSQLPYLRDMGRGRQSLHLRHRYARPLGQTAPPSRRCSIFAARRCQSLRKNAPLSFAHANKSTQTGSSDFFSPFGTWSTYCRTSSLRSLR